MEFVLLLPVLVLSVVVHEYAHAWTANRNGDPTARMVGRLTLNPLVHIDPVGSVLVPVLLWLLPGGFIFGWAKPVPVNPRKFRNYRKGDIQVSLAGIVANLLLAVASALVIVALVNVARLVPSLEPTLELVEQMAWFGIFINLLLAFFNLIPIPPLDGSHVLYHLLPPRLGARYRELGRYGFLVLVALLFFAPGAFTVLLWPVSALQSLVRAFVLLWT